MAEFEKAIPITLQWEGGYVNNPKDPGGETNRGIILFVWQKWAPALGLGQGTSEELKVLTEDQAKAIYKKVFWEGIHGDQINNQSLANQIFDTYVNCGNAAVIMLQHILNITADGQFGPATLAAVNSVQRDIAPEYKAARIGYYNWLPTVNPDLQIFLVGWLRRANSF